MRMRALARVLAPALALCGVCLLGCGARTSLEQLGVDVPSDAETDGGDALLDGGDVSDAVVSDAREDVPFPEDAPLSEVGCRSNGDCDDGLQCTRDVCDRDVGRCRFEPRNERCSDGSFCNGEERCDAQIGCVSAPPPQCADAFECTRDACDEATRSCVHVPDDSTCPISHGCDPSLGCQARAIAHSSSDVYEIRLPSGVVRRIGPTTRSFTDIALHPSGKLYALASDRLCEVDITMGGCAASVPINGNWNGLDAAPNGTLYAAGGDNLYVLDRLTGQATLFAPFPAGTASSGDLAFVGARLLGTATTRDFDVLVEFDLVARSSKIIGSTGETCVWGLAGFGPTLYGLTCRGRVVRIELATGKATLLTTSNVEFWGATAR